MLGVTNVIVVMETPARVLPYTLSSSSALYIVLRSMLVVTSVIVVMEAPAYAAYIYMVIQSSFISPHTHYPLAILPQATLY